MNQIDPIYSSSDLQYRLYQKYLDLAKNTYSYINPGIILNLFDYINHKIPKIVKFRNKVERILGENNDGDFNIAYNFFSSRKEPFFYLPIEEACVLFFSPGLALFTEESYTFTLYYCPDKEDIINELESYLNSIQSKEERKTNIYSIIYERGNWSKLGLEFKDLDFGDLQYNYNDDLPLEEIKKELSNDDSGIMIFNGDPGTGKTYFIRYLTKLYPDKTFLIMPANLFTEILSYRFTEFLYDNKNAIIILEDCENLIVKKEGEIRSDALTSFLNLSNGLYGDSFSFKFICTFNCQESNIDKAILRKGRTKIKYEFRALETDKANKMLKHIGLNTSVNKPTILSELYHIFQTTDFSKKEIKKVGFGV